MTNCQPDFITGGKYKVLAWNMVGTVCLRQEAAFTSIDVDFTDKNKNRNIVINDDFGIVMACIGYSGMFLASKGTGGADDEELDDFIRPDDEDIDMDNNEDDEKNRKKHSHV